jgi:hypothetical protein
LEVVGHFPDQVLLVTQLVLQFGDPVVFFGKFLAEVDNHPNQEIEGSMSKPPGAASLPVVRKKSTAHENQEKGTAQPADEFRA